MHVLVHFFEALVSLLIAYIYFEKGKKYVQYVFLLAAQGVFVAAFLFLTRRKAPGLHH